MSKNIDNSWKDNIDVLEIKIGGKVQEYNPNSYFDSCD